jgi:hypothetical protein
MKLNEPQEPEQQSGLGCLVAAIVFILFLALMSSLGGMFPMQ